MPIIGPIAASLRERYAPLFDGTYRDYVLTIGTNIIAQICLVVTGILTARLLGPAGKGDLTTVLYIPSLMLSFGILSLPQSIALHISRGAGDRQKIESAGFWMSLLLGCAEAAALYPFIPLLLGSKDPSIVRMARICLIYLPIAFAGFSLLGADQGYQRFKRYNVLKHLPTLLYALLLVGMAVFRAVRIEVIVIGFLASQFIATAILITSFRKHLSFDLSVLKGECGRALLRQGLIYTMPALSGLLLMRADLAILVPLVTSEKVGLYSAALAIAMGQNVLTSSIVQVNFPKVCSADRATCARIIRNQLGKALVPIVLIAGILAAVSPLIIRFLLGPAFLGAQGTALVLIAAIMIWCIGQIVDNGLRGAGMGLPSSLSYLAGIGVLGAAAAWLVPRAGPLGMAMAFLLAQVAATGALLAALKRFTKRVQA